MRTLIARKPLLAAMIAGGVGMSVAFAAGYAVAAQPHMQNALRALNNAKAELAVALADKGGHRVNAINLVNQAISEVEAGIAVGAM